MAARGGHGASDCPNGDAHANCHQTARRGERAQFVKSQVCASALLVSVCSVQECLAATLRLGMGQPGAHPVELYPEVVAAPG